MSHSDRNLTFIRNKDDVLLDTLIQEPFEKKQQLCVPLPPLVSTSPSSVSSSPISDVQQELPIIPIARKHKGLKRLYIDARACLSNVLSLFVLSPFVLMAILKTAKSYLYLHKTSRPQDNENKITQVEEISLDEAYYITTWGYENKIHRVETPDGYILKLNRVFKKGCNPEGKRPILIGHGLFQCSGVFVLNEEKSLVFALVDQGYDVWVGNHRCAGGLDHVSLSPHDPEFWDWGLLEIATYDFPALVEYVKAHTQFPKIAYIGHSQGNAQAFMGLSQRPNLSQDLSCFIALAPAVYAGHLIKRFPLSILIQLNDWMFSLIFGVMSFLPFMSSAQTTGIIDPKTYCFLAYSMFVYLFDWWDHHWLRRRKVKYFRFTPRPVSTKLIADWIAGWGRQGRCLYVDEIQSHQYTKAVPFIVFYGTADHIVDGEKLVNTLNDKSNRILSVLDLVHVERIEGYEHMDTIWAHDNHKTTYPIILESLINKAKWD